MVVDLQGILPTGPGLGPAPVPDPRVQVQVFQGADLTVRLTVVDAYGELVDLSAATLAWTWKKKPSDPTAAAIFAGAAPSPAARGRWDFTVVPSDTKQLVPGRYVHDVWLTIGGKRSPVVPASPLVLLPTVAAVP